ncbi:zinc ribbon domain-containing protein [Streptomyces sp. 1114.5]|uniref:zinc ribbon domain-containing protein n=1 Tax=Streptomyces sp. 1114.5 TaxID=1938830 RepID=UPI0037D9BF2F
MGRKHGRTVHLVHPNHTTMECAHCGARAKHRMPLGERTYTCTAARSRGGGGEAVRRACRARATRRGYIRRSPRGAGPSRISGTGRQGADVGQGTSVATAAV